MESLKLYVFVRISFDEVICPCSRVYTLYMSKKLFWGCSFSGLNALVNFTEMIELVKLTVTMTGLSASAESLCIKK